MNDGTQSTEGTAQGSGSAAQARVLRPRGPKPKGRAGTAGTAAKTKTKSSERTARAKNSSASPAGNASSRGATAVGPDLFRLDGVETAARQAMTQGVHPTATAVADRGNSVVSQPIFAFIVAPKLLGISHAELTKWLNLRLEYEEAIRSRCLASGEDINAVMISVRNSFDEALLDTLCEAKWSMLKSDLTDEFLWDWIKSTAAGFKNRVLPDIKTLFRKELAMPMNIDDVDARVTEYVLRCNTVIRTNGLMDLFTGTDGVVKKCKVMVDSLPIKLRDKVKNQIDFQTTEAKSSVSELYKVMIDKSLELETEERGIRETRGTRGAKRSDEGNATEHDRPNKRQRANGKNGKSVKDQKTAGGKNVNNSEKPSFAGTGCWNCHGTHKLQDCNISEEAKKEIIKQRRQKQGRQR